MRLSAAHFLPRLSAYGAKPLGGSRRPYETAAKQGELFSSLLLSLVKNRVILLVKGFEATEARPNVSPGC